MLISAMAETWQKRDSLNRLRFPSKLFLLLSISILISCTKEAPETPEKARELRFTSNIQGAHYWVKAPTYKGELAVSRTEAFNGLTVKNGKPGTAEYYFQKTGNPCAGIYTVTCDGVTIFQINMDTVSSKSGTFEVP